MLFKQILKDESAVALCMPYITESAKICNPLFMAKAIDTLVCGGQGLLKGVCMPITNKLLELILSA